jgi:hypothetical protein
MANRYSYKDPNAGNVVRTAVGDNYSIFALSFCVGGQAIKIYSGNTEVLYSCFLAGSLTIVPIIPPVDNNNPCDCLNGGCIPASTYGTPGAFPTLAACQSGCAKNSNCTGECVDPAEIAALQQAAATLQSKICK